MNQKILDYIENPIDISELNNDDYFNAFKKHGIFIAKNRKDVEKYLKDNQCSNIRHNRASSYIVWTDESDNWWCWCAYSNIHNIRGKRFHKIKIIDDNYDESVIQWLAIYCIPSPYGAEWEIIRRDI